MDKQKNKYKEIQHFQSDLYIKKIRASIKELKPKLIKKGFNELPILYFNLFFELKSSLIS